MLRIGGYGESLDSLFNTLLAFLYPDKFWQDPKLAFSSYVILLRYDLKIDRVSHDFSRLGFLTQAARFYNDLQYLLCRWQILGTSLVLELSVDVSVSPNSTAILQLFSAMCNEDRSFMADTAHLSYTTLHAGARRLSSYSTNCN